MWEYGKGDKIYFGDSWFDYFFEIFFFLFFYVVVFFDYEEGIVGDFRWNEIIIV